MLGVYEGLNGRGSATDRGKKRTRRDDMEGETTPSSENESVSSEEESSRSNDESEPSSTVGKAGATTHRETSPIFRAFKLSTRGWWIRVRLYRFMNI
jgi:hypothetical protein